MKSFQISVEEDDTHRIDFDYNRGSLESVGKIKKRSYKTPIRVFIDGSFYRCVFNVDELKDALNNFLEEEMSKK